MRVQTFKITALSFAWKQSNDWVNSDRTLLLCKPSWEGNISRLGSNLGLWKSYVSAGHILENVATVSYAISFGGHTLTVVLENYLWTLCQNHLPPRCLNRLYKIWYITEENVVGNVMIMWCDGMATAMWLKLQNVCTCIPLADEKSENAPRQTFCNFGATHKIWQLACPTME